MSNEPKLNPGQFQAPEQAQARQDKEWIDRLAWLPIPVFLAAIVILSLLHLPQTFDPPYLLLVLNSIFLTGTCLLVAYLAARSYQASGAEFLLPMGCGMLSLGLGSLLSGAIRPMSDLNATVAIHNFGALLGGLSCLSSALVGFKRASERRLALEIRLRLGIAYLGVVGALTVFAALDLADLLPAFVIPAQGRTLLGWLVMWTAIASFGCSSLLSGVLHRRSGSVFAYWYALALGLIAVGLLGVLALSSTGTVLGWVGRSGQWLGGVYMFIASLAAIRETRAREIPFERAPRESEEKEALASVARFREEIRRAEEMLLQKEADIKEAQRLAHIGSWYWDAKTDATTGSDELLRIYGLDPGTQRMPAFREQRGSLYPAEDWERVNAAVQEALRTGVGYELDVQAIRDGATIWITTRSEVVRDADGQILGMRGTVQDITDRKRAEAALRESEHLLQDVIDGSPSAIFIKDLQGRFTKVNKPLERMLGLAQDSIIGKTDYDILTNARADHYRSNDRKVMETGEAIQVEEVADLVDGEHVYLASKFPLYDSRGRICAVCAISHDITGRKRTQEALRQSEERYRALFNTLIEGFCIIEVLFDADDRPTDYRFLEINPAFETQTGLHNARGKRMRELAPEHEAHWFDIYGKVALTGESTRFVNEAKALNRWYDVSAYRLGGRDSRKVAVLFNDITENKRAESALFESNQRWQALMTAVPVGVSFSDDATCRRITGNPTVLAQFEVAPADNLSASAPNPDAPGRQVQFYQDGRPVSDAELPLQRAVAENDVIAPMELEVLLPSGRRWIAEASGAPVRDVQGNVIGGIAVTVDITERKRAEEALRENEQRLRALGDNLPHGAIYQHLRELDGSVRYAYMSAGIEKVLGITVGQLMADPEAFRQLILEEDRPRCSSAEDKSARELSTFDCEFRQRTVAGDIKWVHCRSTPQRLGNGAIQWDGVVTDVTERKQAEQALQTTLHRFYNVLSSMYVAILLVTDEGRVEFANQAFCDRFDMEDAPIDLMGLDARTMIEKIKNAYLNPVDAIARIREILDRGQPVKGEELAMRDGGTCLRDFVPLKVDGKSCGRLWVHFDITERKRMEEALRESRTKLETAMASMTDAVFLSDCQGRFIEFNDAFATFHRFRNRDECARTFAEYPDILEVYMADGAVAPLDMWAVPRALRGETVTNAEYTLRRKDTGENWVGSYSFGPIRDKDGEIVGAVVAGRDITERKRGEVALRRLNDELEQSVQRLSEANRELKARTQENEAFVYSVSHDLRSPLVNLDGFSKELSRGMQLLRADLLKSDLPQPVRDRELAILDGPMAKAIHFIQTAVTRLSSIIDALLRLSRAGRVVYQRRFVDVHAIATRIIDSLRGTAEERGATIQTGDLPPVLGDPAAVEQIFANLIGNALNYLDRKRPGRIEVGSLGPEHENAGAGLRTYYVRDNGLGISVAGQAKMFQPFQRLYPQASPGEGMGLAIVHRVVERHGGRIWFESAVNQGSTFFVALPSFSAEVAPASPPEEAE